jgi:hypothetical protein
VAKKAGEGYKIEPDHSSISWENEIRSLVRLASLTVLILFVLEIVDLGEAVVLGNDLSVLLKTGLYAIFVAGLFFAYFQIRWINAKRNKITNLGGSFALAGLFISIIPSLIQFYFIDIFSSVDSIYFTLIFGVGLFFAFIGLFFETTRLDELFIYWIKTNIIFATRLIVFSVGLLIMFYGYLNWDFSLSNLVPIIMFGFGYSIGIAIWLNHPYFKLSGSALSVLVSFLGYMIIYSLDNELLVYTEPTNNTGLFLILLGFVANAILWSENIFNFVIRVITYIIDEISKFLNEIISLIKEIINKIDHSIRLFVQFLRDYYKTILRLFFTMVGIFLIYWGGIMFFNNNQPSTILGLVIGTHFMGWWSIVIGIGFIYVASLPQFNQLFREIYKDFKNGVKYFIAWFRIHRKTILLYFQNIIGVLFILIGFIIYSPTDLYWFGAIVLGFIILGVTWWVQIKQIFLDIYKEIVKTGKEIVAWFQLYWKTIIVYSVRLFGFALIIYGFAIIPFGQNTAIGVITILVGAFILGITWRTQTKHAFVYIYSEIVKAGKQFIAWFQLHRETIRLYSTRILGVLFILNGVIFPSLDVSLRVIMIIAGIIVLGLTWLTQIKNTLVYIYSETVKAGKQFIVWFQLHRKTIRLYSTRILGISLILIGCVWIFIDPNIFIGLGTIAFGIILISSTWLTQIKNILIYIYSETIKAGKQFIAWFQLHRKKIRLYTTRIFGTLLILLGFAGQFPVPFLEFILIGLGIILISSTWYTQIKQGSIYIYNEAVKAGNEFIAWFLLNRKAIRLYSTRIFGVVVILIGFVLQFTESILNLVIIGIGIVIISSTWYTQIKQAVIYIYNETDKAVKRFIAWFQLHRKKILLFSVRIMSSLIILIGYFLFYENPLIGILTVAIGFIFLSATWYTEIKGLFVNLYKGIIKAGKDFIVWIKLHQKTILLYSLRILGFSLIFIGYLSLINVNFLSWGVFLILLGIVILGITWLTQIKQTLISIYTNVKKTILHYTHAIYEGLLFFIQFIRNYYIEILRVTLTIFGAIFLFFGLIIPEYLIGSLLILVAWGDLIIKAIIQAIRNLVKFLQNNYIVILQYSLSLIGSFLLLVGFGILINNFFLSDYAIIINIFGNSINMNSIGPVIGLFYVLIGIVLIYGAWYKKINPYLLGVFRKILEFSNQILVSLRDFTSKMLIQLKKLLLSIADSIIPLLILVISFTAIIYGIILILSGIFDTSGDWTNWLANIPLIKEIVGFIQQNPNPTNLLGIWANSSNIELLILGIGFSIAGFVITLLVYLRFEKLKIHNFTSSSQES